MVAQTHMVRYLGIQCYDAVKLVGDYIELLEPAAPRYLSQMHSHPRDSHVAFTEEDHKYYIRLRDGSWFRAPHSTTGFIHKFFPEFDSEKEARGVVERGTNEKYANMTVEDICEAWRKNGSDASARGTAIHNAIERFYNKEDSAETRPNNREFYLFSLFHRGVALKRGWVPFRSELIVYSGRYRLCGSIDIIYVKEANLETDTLVLVMGDWKRAKEFKKRGKFRSSRGLGPCEDLDDCNVMQYMLQLNVYKWFLTTYYSSGWTYNGRVWSNIRVDEMYMIRIHPNAKNVPEVIRVDELGYYVEQMLATLPVYDE